MPSACDSLSLLDALFGPVLVPEAVFREVAAVSKPHSEPLRSYLHGKVRHVDMRHLVFLDAYADAGETADMQLYKELDADYLLIDDRRGRKVAAINQIKTIGSMGVLLQAKRAGLVASIAPLLALIDASPVCISRSLLETVLELAGESDSLRDLLP